MAADIKLAHSVFALPFAILATCMALPAQIEYPTLALQFTLIILCMFFARTWAMLVNRLVDKDFDAQNPRTSRRVFAAGRVSLGAGWTAAAICAGCFVFSCGLFGVLLGNYWPLILSIPVLTLIATYSLTKRFTSLCHLVLGVSLAIAPLAAALAVSPGLTGLPVITLEGRSVGIGTAFAQFNPSLFLLSGMVLAWVAGFDIIYALADIDFDREKKLHSIPAALGWAGAVWVSRSLHLAAFILLALAWKFEPRFGWLFGIGVVVVGALLVLEHIVLVRRGKAGLDMAFFTINGIVSCLLGALGSLDCWF